MRVSADGATVEAVSGEALVGPLTVRCKCKEIDGHVRILGVEKDDMVSTDLYRFIQISRVLTRTDSRYQQIC